MARRAPGSGRAPAARRAARSTPPLPWPAVGEHRARRIMAGGAGDSSARVSARSAQVQAFERHPVIRGADHRPGAEQLVEAHLAVENIAADQPEAALEIERRMDLASEHRLREPRRMGVNRRDDRVRGLLALMIPAPAGPEVETEMLAEQGRDMLALGRQARIERR